MSGCWKRLLRLPPSHNGERPERPDPEAAQRDLERMRDETARMKAETQKYAALGSALRGIRTTNHLAEAFIEAAHKPRGSHG